MKLIASVSLACLLTATTVADVLHLKNGGTIYGTVIQESDDFVTIAMQYGTTKMDRADIAEIERTVLEESTTGSEPVAAMRSDARLPRWSVMVQNLAKLPWAAGLSQIPATVINTGVMRDVPYMSYRCGHGGDYEVNVYGDPDTPAGVEIGVYGALTTDAAAKRRCVEFISSLLPDATDAAILKAARIDQDKVERGGMTIEITPTTAKDAYGGWWVSVYYERRLEKARASENELKAITVARDEPSKPAAKKPAARRIASASAKGTESGWTREDLRRARRPSASTPTPSSGDRVYVRGYYRKDGTYVQGHWRSRPRSR